MRVSSAYGAYADTQKKDFSELDFEDIIIII